jgi:hypothetical protein
MGRISLLATISRSFLCLASRLIGSYLVSERRACRVLHVPRATCRRGADDGETILDTNALSRGWMSELVCWQQLKQGHLFGNSFAEGGNSPSFFLPTKSGGENSCWFLPAPSSRCQPPLAGPAAGVELRGCYETRAPASNLRRILPRGDPFRVVESVGFDQLWHSGVSALSRVELDPRFLYALPLLFHPVHQPLHGEKQAVAEIR